MDVQAMVVAQTVAKDGGGSGIGGFLPLILIVALVFFFMSTQRRRQRAHQQTLASLLPGTLVVTTAGLYATVVEVDEGDVLLEVAPEVVCRFARAAIARVVSAPDDDSQPDGEAAEGEAAEGQPDHHRATGDGGADDRAPAEPSIDMTKKDLPTSGDTPGSESAPGLGKPDGRREPE
ncbi:preprotein translocase subunit YajC [Frankia sp. Cj3]|uniref:preprotein translocase subunit YajC n=1 Tax=Frankia sp. Cj3 TaxID=2880976 RepID=UPI001EF6AA02|nr:preprotein translocase subunit YajC [Frankia sp. Cj3]